MKPHGAEDEFSENGSPEEDYFNCEEKEATVRAALWEADAAAQSGIMEAEAAAAAALSKSSDMEIQHQLVKRPRTLTDESPDQVGKIPAHVPLLLTNGAPETLQQPSSTALTRSEPLPQEILKHSTHRHLSRPPDSSTPPPLWPPSVEGIPIVEIPICQFLADFRASLSLKMQSVYSSPSHATLCPALEGLTSTILIALVGLEKTLLQQPLYPPPPPG